MNKQWRNLDNTAKVFSLDEKSNNNIFRLSAVLKEKVDSEKLKRAVIKTLNLYPNYKVKIKIGLFWNYLETNFKEPIIEEENNIPCKNITLKKNNEFLFKVTYFKNKVNLEIFHILTDGLGATILFKQILYNYFNLKYKLKIDNKESPNNTLYIQDEYLKNADKKLKYKKGYKKAFIIKEKYDLSNNKTSHYILNLKKLKIICKKHNVSISEYLTALYTYAIYKTLYNKSTKKNIVINIPIDLRKRYKVESFSNFFTCMYIEINLSSNNTITFNKILNQVRNEFKNKLSSENIKKYLARDVKLGTNIIIRIVPLFIKKKLMKYIRKVANKTTTTLSNIGQIKIDEEYKKYIDNIMVLTSVGDNQKVKCTVCSYENNLTITINSNLIKNELEKEFYNLLIIYVGKVKLKNKNI